MNNMKEIRIDCANPTKEEMELSMFHTRTLFRLNHTMPFTEEYETSLLYTTPSPRDTRA